MRTQCFTAVVLSFVLTSYAAADWNQWRGNSRSGAASDKVSLINKLPATGLKPLWISQDEIPAARGGGWSSPVVAGGNVYLFTHKKVKRDNVELGKAKYPYLPPEKRTDMTPAEYERYEKNRRDEQEKRSKNYSFQETIYCLNAKTGETVWTNDFRSRYTRFPQSGTPAVVNGRLYILGAGRMARCLDAKTGKDIWKVRLPGEFRDEYMQSSFAITGDVAVVGAGMLFGLNVEDGSVRWQIGSERDKPSHSSPALWTHEGETYVVANRPGGETICVQPTTGKELWREKTLAGRSSPVVTGNLLLTYGSSRKAGLRCYEMTPNAATEKWTFQKVSDSGSSPVVMGDYVYVQGERRLACVNLKSGKGEWTTLLELGNPRYTSLAAADDKVFYTFENVLMFAATPEGFQPLMQAKIDGDGLLADEAFFRKKLNLEDLESSAAGQQKADSLWRKTFKNAGPLSCASPAISDGRLYLRLERGVACYDLSASKK